jgi:oligoribonuclease
MASDMLLWVDIETTGLDPNTDDILEVAWQATTVEGDLIPFSGCYLVKGDVEKCNEYVRKMHTLNGLFADLSDPHPSQEFVEARYITGILDGVARRMSAWGVHVHLAGASVHFDRSFIEAQGGKLEALTHRHVDVSTLKLALPAAKRKCPAVTPKIEHRAWWDVVAEVETYQAIHKILKGRE